MFALQNRHPSFDKPPRFPSSPERVFPEKARTICRDEHPTIFVQRPQEKSTPRPFYLSVTGAEEQEFPWRTFRWDPTSKGVWDFTRREGAWPSSPLKFVYPFCSGSNTDFPNEQQNPPVILLSYNNLVLTEAEPPQIAAESSLDQPPLHAKNILCVQKARASVLELR